MSVYLWKFPMDFYPKSNFSGPGIDQFDGVSCMMFEWLSAAHNATYTYNIALTI